MGAGMTHLIAYIAGIITALVLVRIWSQWTEGV